MGYLDKLLLSESIWTCNIPVFYQGVWYCTLIYLINEDWSSWPLGGSLFSWLGNYLQSRKLCIKFNKVEWISRASKSKDFKGVILGHLLLLIFINDFPVNLGYWIPVYASDIKLWRAARREACYYELHRGVLIMEKRTQKGLTISLQKC